MQARAVAFPPSGGNQARSLSSERLEARGKFFFAGSEKVLLKGVTYGPFAPAESGDQFPDPKTVDADLALMTRLGATTLRTFTVPPRWLLDLAAARGLRVLVGVPWAEHVCFLDSKKLTRDIRGTIARAAEACAGHPAVAALQVYPLVDTELYTPAPRPARPRFTTIAQWYTLQQVEVGGRWPDLSKRAAFERYLTLPAAAPAAELELAVNIGADDPQRERPCRHGWSVAAPHEVTPTAASYRAYIAGSLAEFTVCKSGDVLLRTGWLSDRAAAYLASGRPVITEDTRAARYLPDASGIEWIADLAGARDAVGRVLGDWEDLSRQARRTAVEVLDSARNLAAILA